MGRDIVWIYPKKPPVRLLSRRQPVGSGSSRACCDWEWWPVSCNGKTLDLEWSSSHTGNFWKRGCCFQSVRLVCLGGCHWKLEAPMYELEYWTFYDS